MITLPKWRTVVYPGGVRAQQLGGLALCIHLICGAAHAAVPAAGDAGEDGPEQSSARLVSRYIDYRMTDGVLQGFDREARVWSDVPRRRRGQELSPAELLRVLAVVDSSSVSDASKSEVLFSEGFESGVTCPYCPSAPEYYGTGTWNTWDFSYAPDFGDGETIWGRTCAKKYAGNSSVWSAKWHRDCVSAAQCTGYTWRCADAGGASPVARNDIDSYLRLTQPIQWPDNRAASLRFRSWQGLQPDNSELGFYDQLSVWVYDVNTQWEYPLWSDYHRRASWSLCEVALPQAILLGHSFEVNFYYWIDWNTASAEGVFIDDISITATDIDLEFVTVTQAFPTPDSAAESAHMVARVRNAGTDASVPAVLAYTQVKPLPEAGSPLTDYTGYVTVPSLMPGETRDIDVMVDYANGFEKSTSTGAPTPDKRLIQHELEFRIDPHNVVLETDEDDNDYAWNVWAAWNLEKPIIILVHGILGGGLAKDGEPVWNDDAARMLRSLTVERGKIARDSTTVREAAGGPMTIPPAYSPPGTDVGGGFLRRVHLDLPVVIDPDGFAFSDPGMASVVIDMPGTANMWGPLIENLTTEHQYLLGHDLLLFNYDWRLDLNPDNPPVDGRKSSVALLDSLIQNVRTRTGGDRLTVISHSMGGLLVAADLRENPASHGIYRWISLGSPFQGSVDAMATLFGANGGPLGKVPVLRDLLGPGIGAANADLAQEYVSSWELLPTPRFDAAAPGVPWRWEGPEVFADIGNCAYPCLGVTSPVYPQYTMAEVKTNVSECCWGFGWKHNTDSRQRSERFQVDFMHMDRGSPLPSVDTWLIACPNRLTMRGVARYEAAMPYLDGVLPSFLKPTYYGVIFSNGDGTVPEWSAKNVNVPRDNLHVRYRDNVSHADLIQDNMTADFITALTQDQPLAPFDYTVPADSSRIWSTTQDNERPWVVEWRNTASVWNVAKSQQELPVFPVTLELYDRTTGRMLIGSVQVPPPAGEVGAEPVVLQTVLDDRFSSYSFGSQITIASNSQETLHLRLVIRPSPELYWDAAGAPPAKSGVVSVNDEFIVAGQLLVADVASRRLFPGTESPDRYVVFNKVGMPWAAHGFQAYLDIDVSGGIVQNSTGTWFLMVDSDGDGLFDQQVSGVKPEQDLPGSAYGVRAFPNPFNPTTEIRWSLAGAAAARLVIHDVAGNVVMRYDLDSDSASGQAIWNGRDQAGRQAPSGIYFAVLQSGEGRPLTSTKLTLLK